MTPDPPPPHDYTKEIRDLVILHRLVRDADRLLSAEEMIKVSWGKDVDDWHLAAAPFVRGDR